MFKKLEGCPDESCRKPEERVRSIKSEVSCMNCSTPLGLGSCCTLFGNGVGNRNEVLSWRPNTSLVVRHRPKMFEFFGLEDPKGINLRNLTTCEMARFWN